MTFNPNNVGLLIIIKIKLHCRLEFKIAKSLTIFNVRNVINCGTFLTFLNLTLFDKDLEKVTNKGVINLQNQHLYEAYIKIEILTVKLSACNVTFTIC